MTGILEAKKAHSFRVIFSGFGTDKQRQVLSEQVFDCTRPVVVFDIERKGSGYTSSNPHWEPLEIRFRDDLTNIVASEIDAQLQKQRNDEYENFEMVIEVLRDFTDVVERFRLFKCRIAFLDNGELEYVNSGPLSKKLKVTFEEAAVNLLPPQSE